MPRKQINHPENYFKAFPTVLRNLIRMRRITKQDLANHLGKTRQAISYYCDGSSNPDWETIVKIADFFSVTADYLLGRESCQSHEKQIVHELTGLSQEAIDVLASLTSSAQYGELLRNAVDSQALLDEADKVTFVTDAVSFESVETHALNRLIVSKHFPELLSTLNACETNWFFGSGLDALLDYVEDNAKPEYNERAKRMIEMMRQRATYESEEASIMALQNVTRKIAEEIMKRA